MAAFTSVTSGDWNDPATWGNGAGGEYPFKSSAADTATVAHTVTVAADNPYAGSGAVSIAAGGELTISNHVCAQNFCGAITVASGGKLTSADNAAAKKLAVAGSVTIGAGAEFFWRRASELYFDSPSSASIYGLDAESGSKFTLSGASSASRDSKITGNSTNGCYVVITGNTWTPGNIAINNATFDYVNKKGTGVNGVTIQYVNCKNEAECAIDGLDVTNIMNTYGLTFVGGTVVNMKNIRAGSTTNSKSGVYLSGCVVKGENTISGKSSSGYGIRLLYCIVNGSGSVFSGEATSGRGISAESCMIGSWAASGVCTGGQGVVLQGCSVRGGETAASAGAGYGIHWGGSVVLGGVHTAAANPSSGYAHLFSQTEIAGGTINAAQAKYGFYWYFSVVSYHVGGRLIATGCANAVYPHANALFDTSLQKDGFKDVWLFGNTVDITNSPTWREPIIYHNHESDKTAAIYFECSPFNLSDFTTSGVTRSGTNLDIAAG